MVLVPTEQPADAARASDAEREAVAERLREACAEGRLTFEELSERSEAAYTALTSGELAVLTADLPTTVPVPAARSGSSERSQGRRWFVAVLGDSEQAGRQRVDRPLAAVAVLGDCKIDLRQAIVSESEVEISAVALLGDVIITVPDGVEVGLTGMALLGDKVLRVENGPLLAGVPRVHVSAVAVLGDVKVESEGARQESRQRRAERRQLRAERVRRALGR